MARSWLGVGRRRISCGAALLAGCAARQQPEVVQVATRFASGDAALPCGLLAPASVSALEKSESAACLQVVGEPAPFGAQVQRAVVRGDEAQVQMADDTLFLTRTDGGWKVAAAECTPSGEAPYACRLEGP